MAISNAFSSFLDDMKEPPLEATLVSKEGLVVEEGTLEVQPANPEVLKMSNSLDALQENADTVSDLTNYLTEASNNGVDAASLEAISQLLIRRSGVDPRLHLNVALESYSYEASLEELVKYQVSNEGITEFISNMFKKLWELLTSFGRRLKAGLLKIWESFKNLFSKSKKIKKNLEVADELNDVVKATKEDIAKGFKAMHDLDKTVSELYEELEKEAKKNEERNKSFSSDFGVDIEDIMKSFEKGMEKNKDKESGKEPTKEDITNVQESIEATEAKIRDVEKREFEFKMAQFGYTGKADLGDIINFMQSTSSRFEKRFLGPLLHVNNYMNNVVNPSLSDLLDEIARMGDTDKALGEVTTIYKEISKDFRTFTNIKFKPLKDKTRKNSLVKGDKVLRLGAELYDSDTSIEDDQLFIELDYNDNQELLGFMMDYDLPKRDIDESSQKVTLGDIDIDELTGTLGVLTRSMNSVERNGKLYADNIEQAIKTLNKLQDSKLTNGMVALKALENIDENNDINLYGNISRLIPQIIKVNTFYQATVLGGTCQMFNSFSDSSYDNLNLLSQALIEKSALNIRLALLKYQ